MWGIIYKGCEELYIKGVWGIIYKGLWGIIYKGLWGIIYKGCEELYIVVISRNPPFCLAWSA